jgi:hypothetical protein
VEEQAVQMQQQRKKKKKKEEKSTTNNNHNNKGECEHVRWGGCLFTMVATTEHNFTISTPSHHISQR